MGVLPVDGSVTTPDHLLLDVGSSHEELTNGPSIPIGRYPAEVDGPTEH